MNEELAREILGKHDIEILEDGSLYNLGHYTAWNVGHSSATLDCRFEAEELEAIAWWMRNHAAPSK